ncbi:MAG: hypothetical protein KF725_08115 [Cyclobacteriaceae bacterium]|nr:hypothetical protein [Cyclobacteriaceae bacterium]UYN87919.1 MAG: hypothetical protein KIT51_06610 [Cyclobacteriaceae bacterium]
MNKTILLILFLFPVAANAQLRKYDWWLAGTAERADFQGFRAYNAIGIRGEVMLTKVWGIETGLAGGQDYFHLNPGTVVAPMLILFLAISNGSESEGSLGGLALLLLSIASMAEHSNFHIPLGGGVEVVPFFSLIRYRYMYDMQLSPAGGHNYASWSVGSKLSFISSKNWLVNASIERSQLYYPGRPYGIHAGINIGYIFRSKSESKFLK